MILIGENLNVMSKVLGPAMKNKDPKPIQEMAVREAEAGVDVIDLNLGPARKFGHDVMPWLVKTVQEVTDLPLYLDTSNIEAIREGLKVYQPKKGKAIINSIMARPERMDALIPIAKEYDAAFVALLWGPEGMPRDTDERAMLAASLLEASMMAEIAPEDMWFDPIVTPVNVQQEQLPHCLAFFDFQGDLTPGSTNTCGLSNVSNGCPEHLRPVMNRAFLLQLLNHGIESAIVDAFDDKFTEIARGKRPELVELARKVEMGEDVDAGSLNEEELQYYKSFNVLLGNALYSDSWLDI